MAVRATNQAPPSSPQFNNRKNKVMKSTNHTTKTNTALYGLLSGLLFLAAGTAQSHAVLILMNPTTNDGSFESNTIGTNISPITLPPVWTITTSGPNAGGLLANPPHTVTLAGADGSDALFADGGSPNVTTATSFNLLGGAYTAVSAGDVFTWSFMVNSFKADGAGTLRLNFGGPLVTVGTGFAGDADLSTFNTISGTYTATAADALGGQLSAVFSIATATGPGTVNVYGDNVQLSVEPVPEPASALLLLGSGAMLLLRRRRASV